MKTPKISIIIPNYNSQKYLARCLESISKQSFTDFELIIIDGGSVDNSVDWLSKNHSEVHLIANPTNQGFAKSCNQAAASAKGEFLFFLNPDTHLSKNCLDELMAAAKKEKTGGIFAPCQFTYDGAQFISCGVGADIFGYPFSLTKHRFEKGEEPFYVDGAALLIKKEIFNKLGRFDESTFLFMEDIDLSWKARLVGLKIVQVKDAVVFHQSGGIIEGGAIKKNQKYVTNTFRRYLGERNNIRNLLKNYYFYTLFWILPLYLLINCAEILLFLVLLRPRAIWCYLKAWLWNIAYLPDTLSQRAWIQPIRKVGDGEIQKRMYHGSAKFAIFLRIGVPRFK